MKHSMLVVSLSLLIGGCSGAVPPSGEEAPGQTTEALSQIWSYGGSYQLDDCGGDNVWNALNSNQTSCNTDAGFSASAHSSTTGNRQLDPESRCGGNDFFCTKSGYPQLGPGGIAGMFQIDDCHGDDVGNTANNNALSCPGAVTSLGWQGYQTWRIARVLGPESGCGGWQFVCTGGTGRDHFFGGTYQIDDCGQNTKNNPLTGAPNCPNNYFPKQYGRVKGAEFSQCGVRQYWCDAGLSGL